MPRPGDSAPRQIRRLPVVTGDAGPDRHTVDYDEDAPWEPRCIACERPRSQHATPVDLGGGETMVPVCEVLHPGGLLPYGPPPPPGPRPLAVRLQIARQMPLVRAHAIAGSLGEPSKMPGPSYGLDAFVCQVGSELALIPNSSCYGCYARRNFYKYYHPAIKARWRRQHAIHHPYWVEAMIALLEHAFRAGEEPVFRWHDSGDLYDHVHVANLCAVAEATPWLRQWLPTREYGHLVEYLRRGGRIPPNLTIRLSAYMIGERAEVPPELAHLPTSTVHQVDQPPVPVSDRRKDTLACRAWTRDNTCGGCRACWDPRVKNVSYPLH